MFKAIEVYADLSNRKRTIIKNILISYRKTELKIANYQWKLFFQIGSFNRKDNIKHIGSELSERYKSTIQYHLVVPTLENFISNVRNMFRDIVLSSTLQGKTKRVLLYLNSGSKWFLRKISVVF